MFLHRHHPPRGAQPLCVPAPNLHPQHNTHTPQNPHLQCVKIIYGYMGFSTFLIFFFMTGGILIDVAQTIDLHVDAITMALFLYNFGCVGSVILFFTPAPMLLKQVRPRVSRQPCARSDTARPSPQHSRPSGCAKARPPAHTPAA